MGYFCGSEFKFETLLDCFCIILISLSSDSDLAIKHLISCNQSAIKLKANTQLDERKRNEKKNQTSNKTLATGPGPKRLGIFSRVDFFRLGPQLKLVFR